MPGRNFFILTLVTLLTLGAASPAFADCCDSIIDCAATIATDGVSCAIQEFIDSIKDLASFVQNLLDQASGATSSATRGAEAAVTSTINDMTAETSHNAEALRASEAQGAQLARNEAQFKILAAKTVNSVPTVNATPKPAAPPATTRPMAARRVVPAPPPPPTNSTRAMLNNPNAAPVHLSAPKSAPTMTAPLAAAASDPKTRDAVINLLSSESAKRASMAKRSHPIISLRGPLSGGRETMAETQLDVRGLSKAEAYRTLRAQFDALCEGVTDEIALMSTMACVLHLGFGHLWTGFYRLVRPATLLVGPFQGTIGCMEIEVGKGVCGTAAARKETVIVPDVDAFPGHIACDGHSRSEIVVPVFDRAHALIAVLDIDSAQLETFDEDDQRELESWVQWFAKAV